MLTLAEYESHARRMISLWKRKRSLYISYDQEELLGSVIRSMCWTDRKYDHIKDEKERKRLRKMGAIWGIRTYLKLQTKKYTNSLIDRNVDLDEVYSTYPNKVGEKYQTSPAREKLLQFLVNSSKLTKRERLIVDHYLMGMNYRDIGEAIGLPYGRVYTLFNRAVAKMKDIIK